MWQPEVVSYAQIRVLGVSAESTGSKADPPRGDGQRKRGKAFRYPRFEGTANARTGCRIHPEMLAYRWPGRTFPRGGASAGNGEA
jgi:hypothetical protein